MEHMDSVAPPMWSNKMVAVLFVCLGNICRSPAAEAILQNIAKKNNFDLKVASCGLGWNIGEPPYYLMQEAAHKHGVSMSGKSKAFECDFFDHFDYILTATKQIQNQLKKHATTVQHQAKIHLMSEYSKIYKDQDVPDPFNKDVNAFDETFYMLEECCLELFHHLKNVKISNS